LWRTAGLARAGILDDKPHTMLYITGNPLSGYSTPQNQPAVTAGNDYGELNRADRVAYHIFKKLDLMSQFWKPGMTCSRLEMLLLFQAATTHNLA